MGRITKPNFKYNPTNIIQGMTKYVEIDDIMKTLQAYEDTNLEPSEIERLKAENKRLKEALRSIKESINFAFEQRNKSTNYTELAINHGLSLSRIDLTLSKLDLSQPPETESEGSK
jgi:hypothetical protein